MTVGTPLLLNATHEVSLVDAVVGEKWSNPNIAQLRKLSINSLTEAQQFNRFLDWFGRSCN